MGFFYLQIQYMKKRPEAKATNCNRINSDEMRNEARSIPSFTKESTSE